MHYLRISKVYGNIPCPRNRLPILGNILSLPLNPYSKKTVYQKVKSIFYYFAEFSRKLDECYEESKNCELYSLWLGTHPLIAFFHPVGLEVCEKISFL